MFRCISCRNAFVAPMPDESYLADFYSNYHVGEGDDGNYANEAKMRARHPAQIALVRAHTGGDPGRLLDIGCGKGFFLRECVDQGIACAGIELSDTAADYARRELGLDVIAGRLDEIGSAPADRKPALLTSSLYASEGAFDTATMWGVIEHLRDPLKMLCATARVLRPGGKLFVQTGIGDDWLERLLPGVNQWYDPPQHLFVFSAPGIQACGERAGFDLAHIDCWYEYSQSRRVVKFVRNGATAFMLRAVATLGRLARPPFQVTKFPLALDMFAVFTKR
ncbi:MAG: class I SAM-dependent methyltransferase [Phycisphaerae bacterium]|nr:class I SAM-dependent methyltransferase [Phycisphaerae bacterium]